MVATRSPRRLAVTIAETSIAEMSMAAAARFTAVAGTTAAEDITALGLDSVSASMHLTDTPLQSAIPLDSMTQTVCGNPIRVAPCRTDIKLDAGQDRSIATAPAIAVQGRLLNLPLGRRSQS